VKEKLKATILQVGTPTIFWTLSCAEFHWPEFRSMFVDENVMNQSEVLRDNIIKNPHWIDWFFTIRVKNFVKYWLYDIMGATWHWYGFEYAVMRGSIHCHGLAKLKDDPGLCKLTETALTGFLTKVKLDSGEINDSEKLITEGENAEKIVCSYIDTIVSAQNPLDTEEWLKPIIHPCKKTFKM